MAFYAKSGANRELTEMSSYDRLTDLLAKELTPEVVAPLMAEGAMWSEHRAVEVATSDP